jgi:hypothetical protein
MTTAGLVVVSSFFAAPLICWALLARTKIFGWTFAAVFAAGAATEGMLAAGWRFAGERLMLLGVLAVAALIALVAGVAIEARQPGVPRLGSSIRGRAGAVLSVCYGLACLGPFLLLAVVNGDVAPGVGAPSAADVLPLGPGLAVTEQDLGCGNGYYATCSVRFKVVSTSGLPAPAVLWRVESQLTRIHGWRLTYDGGWRGCREDGPQQVCAEINDDTLPRTVVIDLEGGPADLGSG